MVTLEITFRGLSSFADANGLADALASHIVETFNDDNSLLQIDDVLLGGARVTLYNSPIE